MKKRIIVLFVVSSMILSSSSVLSTDVVKNDNSSIPESHLINDVPCVSQERFSFCYHAALASVYQYFGINTTLDELLYITGAGYSLYYPRPSVEKKRLPMYGNVMPDDQEEKGSYANLYGVIEKDWSNVSESYSIYEHWDEYWARIKQNISKNMPILIAVDAYSLPSYRSLKIFNFPDIFWDIMPPAQHTIIIVGYNQTNDTICYNDPDTEMFGGGDSGLYVWMDLKTLKKSINRGPCAVIESFEKISEPLSKEEIFEITHKKNIEAMKGNVSVYNEYLVNFTDGAEFGINGLKLLKNDFQRGLNKRGKTILLYEFQGLSSISNTMLNLFYLVFDVPDFVYWIIHHNEYYKIIHAKIRTAKYLENHINDFDFDFKEINLLNCEIQNWTKLESYYFEFMKKIFFMSLPRAFILMNKMADTVDNIINIEQAIIALYN